MKKITLLFSMLFIMAFANGQKILVLDEPCLGTETPYITALANLGYTAIQTNVADFTTDILGDSYDLVIFSVYNSVLNDTHWDALNTYLIGGGRIIVSSWTYNDSHILFGNMGVQIISTFQVPIGMYQWEAGHELFTTPNAVSSAIIPDLDPCPTDGVRGNALVGATAVAGLGNPEFAVDSAVVIINTTENSIFMGQVPYVWSNAVIVPFLENQIEFLLKDYVGVNDIAEFGIDIYPNPVADNFTIKNAYGFDVVITDISGKTIKQFSINDNEFVIDMSKQASGIYFIQLLSEDIVETVKIVKN